MRYLDGNVECLVCGNLNWSGTVYARINRDKGYDYYCRPCMHALEKRIKDRNTATPRNKRELEYIKKKGLELW